MPLKKYGVLKGTAVGRLRDADDDHYQVLIDDGRTMHRIAVNVKSSAKNAPSTLLFQTTSALPDALKTGLAALKPGFTKLPTKPGGLAQDYVRGGIAKPAKMTPVPPDSPGADNDLKDKLEDAIRDAMDADGSAVYAFGEKWGPETGKKDKYFKFSPGNGIHDIHMNQGNGGTWKKDNGVYQDGCLMVQYPGAKWRAFFFTFQSQTFNTDDKGHPRTGTPAPGKPKKKAARKKPTRGSGATV